MTRALQDLAFSEYLLEFVMRVRLLRHGLGKSVSLKRRKGAHPRIHCVLGMHLKHMQQAFREFLVSLALISNLNGHKSVELSHAKCKILTYFMMSFICSL